MSWTVAVEAELDRDVRDAILRPLQAHNESAVGDGGWAPFAITVRDAAGVVAGGLWGSLWHGFLYIELLALGEARGDGIGAQVMRLAESEARARGCTGLWLDTFTFQAPAFYARLGFVEFGRIAGYPPGHDRIFLLKRLLPDG